MHDIIVFIYTWIIPIVAVVFPAGILFNQLTGKYQYEREKKKLEEYRDEINKLLANSTRKLSQTANEEFHKKANKFDIILEHLISKIEKLEENCDAIHKRNLDLYAEIENLQKTIREKDAIIAKKIKQVERLRSKRLEVENDLSF